MYLFCEVKLVPFFIINELRVHSKNNLTSFLILHISIQNLCVPAIIDTIELTYVGRSWYYQNYTRIWTWTSVHCFGLIDSSEQFVMKTKHHTVNKCMFWTVNTYKHYEILFKSMFKYLFIWHSSCKVLIKDTWFILSG